MWLVSPPTCLVFLPSLSAPSSLYKSSSHINFFLFCFIFLVTTVLELTDEAWWNHQWLLKRWQWFPHSQNLLMPLVQAEHTEWALRLSPFPTHGSCWQAHSFADSVWASTVPLSLWLVWLCPGQKMTFLVVLFSFLPSVSCSLFLFSPSIFYHCISL